MFELKGKYNTAKIFTDVVDESAISQIINMLNQEFIKDSQVRIMPDAHAGAGCTIGTTMTITDKIVPNLVGVDIGCFTGDTKVWCAGGYYKTIKELVELGSSFMTNSFDRKRACFVNAKAIARKTRTNAELVQVSFRKKSLLTKTETINIRCTPDHKFLIKGEDLRHTGWIEARSLLPGDLLVAEDLDVEVVNIKKLDEHEDVYCLNVPEYHNFAIELGVIVHNCGMETIKLKEKHIELQKLDKLIYAKIPSGFSIREKTHRYLEQVDLSKLYCYHCINIDRAERSLGTLGGGNHFIEANKDSNGHIYIVVHSGSRHLGLEVANHYQEAGYEALNSVSKQDIDALIARLKIEGKSKEINKELKKLKDNSKSNIPKALAYVQGNLFNQYIHDMKIVQQYAMLSRQAMIDEIVKGMGLHITDQFTTIHNYIDTKNMILRKGAVSARQGERLLIPINMRDGSLICVGKGNPDWNYSAPHGAGRLLSRSKAKESLTVSQFKKEMKGIYTTSVNQSTLDESPMAYKNMDDIVNNIRDTVDIIDVIKPIYNFKAGSED